jgi:hypothetical protein
VTTITGNHDRSGKTHRSRSSSQEQLAYPENITKLTVVEFDDDLGLEEDEHGRSITALPPVHGKR